MCGFHCSRERGGEGPNDQIVSVKRAADGRRQRSKEIIDEKREKYRAKNTDPCGTPRGERMELDSRKKSRRDRMMRSKSFDMQKVREIGWKEAGESRGFPILWMEIMEDALQVEGKECKDQERLKM